MDDVDSLLDELVSGNSFDLIAAGGITRRGGRSSHCHRCEYKIYTQRQKASQDGRWFEEIGTLFKADGPFIQVRWPNCQITYVVATSYHIRQTNPRVCRPPFVTHSLF